MHFQGSYSTSGDDRQHIIKHYGLCDATQYQFKCKFILDCETYTHKASYKVCLARHDMQQKNFFGSSKSHYSSYILPLCRQLQGHTVISFGFCWNWKNIFFLLHIMSSKTYLVQCLVGVCLAMQNFDHLSGKNPCLVVYSVSQVFNLF